MQNNGAFNVLSAASVVPSWNLGLQPSTSHSDSGGSAGMLPMASPSTGRPPIRDGQLHEFCQEHDNFPLVSCRCYVDIFRDVESCHAHWSAVFSQSGTKYSGLVETWKYCLNVQKILLY